MKAYPSLYLQVLIAIGLGIALGYWLPDLGVALKPLGDGFIKLVKMLIAPIIFCTVVTGIAGVQDSRKMGRVGVKALCYFEVVSTLALLIGLAVVHGLEPGVGMNADIAHLDTSALKTYTEAAKTTSLSEFLLNVIPTSVVDAFAKGDVLQVLLFSILFGFALSAMKDQGVAVVTFIAKLADALFGVVETVMKLAPLGAFGAMAFTIGKFGLISLAALFKLMACFYLTCALFIIIVLGCVARWTGFSLVKFIIYIKDELLIVLATSSSESVLPRIMQKLHCLGASRSVVGLVIPTGYSFNLDGTAIYLSMAAIFIAQATNTELTPAQELVLFGVLLVTSKGAAGVTGSGFITLAATLAAVPSIPIEGLALILGVDRFMSEARALTNLIGNGVATLVAAKWEGELDLAVLQRELNSSEL